MEDVGTMLIVSVDMLCLARGYDCRSHVMIPCKYTRGLPCTFLPPYVLSFALLVVLADVHPYFFVVIIALIL
jgi:hypothetical protein